MNTEIQSPKKQSLHLLFVMIAIIGAGFLFAYFQHENLDNRVNFSLIDTSGAEISQRDMGGKWMLVYFGFTSCPDICPTQTAKVAQTVKYLDKKRLGDDIVPVFISVDYKRDNPEKIKRYLAQFDQRIMGLTGSKEQLDQTTQSFHTHYELKENPAAVHHGGVDVVHSSMTYIVDPFGKIVDQIAYGYDPVFLADHIEKLL
ncbi:MAG: SCO family protein [Pseudomonadales bacterium]|nr:SCO family protein [Pseudomonadales bacterium]